jgi:lipoprotein-releasing system permease protein
MIPRLEAFIGWRYARTRRAGLAVSFITLASLIGVALGVAAMITILSVMNGFEAELRDRLVSLSAHATLSADGPVAPDWEALAGWAAREPGVIGVAPFLERQALLVNGSAMNGAVLRGIEPGAEATIGSIGRSMVEGDLAALDAGSNRIVLGRVLAFELGVAVGDAVTVMIPEPTAAGADIVPRIRSFTVAGIFEVGVQDHDGVLALVNIADAQAFADQARPDGLRLRFADLYGAPRLARKVAQAVGGDLKVRDWTEENATYFRAIRLEKTMMTLMLGLVVAVAAFNIVASLVMVVRAKRTDIAILRTLGMRPRGVVLVFLIQGLVIGWGGALAGVGLGLLLATNAEQIVAFLQQALHFQLFSADVYYVTRIPSLVRAPDVIAIAVAAFVLTLLATIYPALRAARTEPAEALRYE